MHEALVDQRIDRRGGLAVGDGGVIFLAAGNRFDRLTDGRTRTRTQRDVSGALLDGLTGGFLCGLGVGHCLCSKGLKKGAYFRGDPATCQRFPGSGSGIVRVPS